MPVYGDVMTWAHYPCYWPYVRETQRLPLAINAEVWCLFTCYPEQAYEQTAQLPMLQDAMTLMWRDSNARHQWPPY